MERLGRLIRMRRKHLGMSQQELGDAVGLSSQLISHIENGRRRVDLDHVDAFSRVLGIPYSEFIKPAADDDLPPGAFPVEGMVRLPVIAQVRAGEPQLPVEEYEETAPVNPDDIRGGDYFWMRIDGDSMTGTQGLYPGALVLVRRQPYVDDGQVAVVDIEGEGPVIKRVHYANDRLVLMSTNPIYPPLTINADRCRIIGRAVKHYGDII